MGTEQPVVRVPIPRTAEDSPQDAMRYTIINLLQVHKHIEIGWINFCATFRILAKVKSLSSVSQYERVATIFKSGY